MNGLATRQRLRKPPARATTDPEPVALPIDRIVCGVSIVLLVFMIADQVFQWRVFS